MTRHNRDMPHVSSRGLSLPASPIRKLAPLAESAKARGVRVLHLNIGQPDLETPAALREQLTHVDPVIAYSPSGGTTGSIDAMRTYYKTMGQELERQHILATTGGSEAVFFSFLCLTSPGDEVIVAEPFYTNYASFAAMTGTRLVAVRCNGEDGFHLPSRGAFDAAWSSRTRMVLLCNPNNPTGTVYSREEMDRVLAFCRDRDLFFVSDEVYREFVYDGSPAVSALSFSDDADRVVVVDSLSKRFSACGIRLGAFITRNAAVMAVVNRAAQGRLSPPGLAQLMALGIPKILPEYYARVRDEYQSRRDTLYAGLCAIPGVFLRRPEGAFYVVARLPVDDAEEFAKFLLQDFSLDNETVMVAPAAGFYVTPGLGKNEVRIAYVLKNEDLKRAIRILEAGISAFRKR